MFGKKKNKKQQANEQPRDWGERAAEALVYGDRAIAQHPVTAAQRKAIELRGDN